MASLYVPSRIGSPTGSGYKLYFYQTGTTTPVDTFSQSDLAPGHENTNPVVADSNGLFGPIYLKATPDYKAVLTDASGNVKWTTDPLLTAATSVITTRGDLIIGNSSNVAARLPVGTSGQYLRSDGTDPSWHALSATDLSGTVPKLSLPSGAIIQSVISSTNAYSSHTTSIPYDNTIPQIGEGELLLTTAITPTSTSTIVRATSLTWVDGNATEASCALFRGAGANALAAGTSFTNTDFVQPLPVVYQDVPGSVAAQSYTLRVGPNSGTIYINGTSGGRIFGGVFYSFLMLEEVVP